MIEKRIEGRGRKGHKRDFELVQMPRSKDVSQNKTAKSSRKSNSIV